MAHVVCEPCVDCKYTDCVVVCPVDCFFQDEKMLYIDSTCIDCEACVKECPVESIYQESNVPAQWENYRALNLERATAIKLAGGNVVKEKQDPKEGEGCKKGS